MSLELETINKLYLELSQFATAKTAKEIALEERLARMEGLYFSSVGTPIVDDGRIFGASSMEIERKLRDTP